MKPCIRKPTQARLQATLRFQQPTPTSPTATNGETPENGPTADAGPTEYDTRLGNVLKCPRIGQKRDHQTETPVNLMEQLIRVVCPPGGVVLDPFGGSGTTGVAAQNIGRDAICIERDAGHVETSRRRLTTEGQITLIDG